MIVSREVGLKPDATSWPLVEALRSHEAGLLADVGPRMGEVHVGSWPEPVGRALLLPMSLESEGSLETVLVLGLSPRLTLDETYRDFLQLLARQLVADLVRVRALEQEKLRAEKLAEMDRVKTAFFSNVSHEFRTPLTLMLGPTEDALASPGRSLGGAELEMVHRNELRLLKLVNMLLDVSRLESGRAQGTFEATDLARLTRDLASAFRSAVERAGLRLDVDCPELPEPVWVDPDHWEKIVLNLLSNALKFTFAGEISVSLRSLGSQVELCVRDTGTGIPAEQLPKLFERFHRVQGARARTHEGSGIGLALVRELARLHGGDIEVRSDVNVGTTFTLHLPTGKGHLPVERLGASRAAPPSLPGTRAFVEEALRWVPGTRPAPAPRASRSSGRILLAEDNADMRDYISRLLGERWTVEAVGDGQEALESARRAPPDRSTASATQHGHAELIDEKTRCVRPR